MCEGDVFYYCVDRDWDDPPHPKIVVAITPNRRVIFVHATKDYGLAYRMASDAEPNSKGKLKTLVEIKSGACASIPHDSWIECNGYYEEAERTIVTSSSYGHSGSATHPLMGAIRLALLSSGVISADRMAPIRKSLIDRANKRIPF